MPQTGHLVLGFGVFWGFGVFGVSMFRGGVVMTFVLLEHMGCCRHDTGFYRVWGFEVFGVSRFRGGIVMTDVALEHYIGRRACLPQLYTRTLFLPSLCMRTLI